MPPPLPSLHQRRLLLRFLTNTTTTPTSHATCPKPTFSSPCFTTSHSPKFPFSPFSRPFSSNQETLTETKKIALALSNELSATASGSDNPLAVSQSLHLGFCHVDPTPDLILQTLNLAPEAGRSVLGFNHWLVQNPNFKHTDETVSFFVDYFGRRKDFKAGLDIISENKGVLGAKTLESVIDCVCKLCREKGPFGLQLEAEKVLLEMDYHGIPRNAESFNSTLFRQQMHQNFITSDRHIPASSPFARTSSTRLHLCLNPLNPRSSGFKGFRQMAFVRFFSYSTHQQHRRAPDPDDPASLLKEDGVSICSQMWLENFREPDRIVTNLTSYLRRFELWVLAYQKVCCDEIGAYVPRSSIQRSALEDLLALRNAVLDDRFKWGARLDFFIKSPRDKTDYESLSKRKIKAILTTTQPAPFQDKIVQEVLLIILEPIYEARFSQKSYAFRPGRTAHTVLRVIRRSFAGYLWYIKGDLSVILDGMKVGLVIGSLMRDVRDKKVIDLIKLALVTPVITSKPDDGEKKKKKKRKYQKKRVLAEDEPKPDPYWLETFFGFAPEEAEKVPSWGHCGILSPLLVNICLDELDRWMEGKTKEFYRPSKSDVIWNSPEGEADQGNTSWPEFVPTSGPDKTRKMDYIRYGGHILIGVRGPRADAATLRKQLIEFCDQKYMLKLDNESLPIEHITKGIMFLDHVLCRRVVYPTLRYTATGGKIISEKGVGTLLSVTASLKQCVKQFRKLSFIKGDRDPDPQPCFRMFHATQAHTNAQMNKFLTTIAEWYRYSDNRKKVVNFCSYIIRGSLAKLYAAKYKLRSRAKVYKIGARNLGRPLKEKKGQSPEYHNLLRMGLAESIDGLVYTRMSLVPETDYTPFPSNWRPEHEKALIEYIRLDDPKTLEDQRNCIREQGLVSPQDYISMLVWNYKRNMIPMDQVSLLKSVTSSDMEKDQALLLGSSKSDYDRKSKEEEESEEGFHVARVSYV